MEKELNENFSLIQLTPEDQAANIRALIRLCWDTVDQYSMYAQQLNEYGNQQALETVNCLINDLYIAIGSFEDILTTVDQKSTSIDATNEVQAVAAVAPQVIPQMVAPQVPVIEKFILSEEDALTEELEEKPEVQKDLEEPIKKELKEVEEYREDKVEDSLNPDKEEDLEEDLGDDTTYNAKFYEALLSLEEE